MKDLNAVLPASGKNGDDTGWVRFKLPIASDPGQIQGAVDKLTSHSQSSRLERGPQWHRLSRCRDRVYCARLIRQ